MSSCSEIHISDLSLVVEIPQSRDYLVEIQQNNLSVEIAQCSDNLIIEHSGKNQHPIVVENKQNFFIEIEEKTLIIEFPDSVVVNNPDAPPSVNDITSVVCLFEAGEDVNVNRAVAIKPDGRIAHADKDDSEEPCDVVGVTRQSGAIGQFVEVVKFGRLTGFTFGTPGENMFLGNDGKIVNSVSTTGFWLSIGTQIANNELFVNVGEPIRRN